MSRHADQISEMTNRELVAFWNVLQFQALGGLNVKRKISLAKKELVKRGAKPVEGKRIILTKEKRK